jgi:hypothetical protein
MPLHFQVVVTSVQTKDKLNVVVQCWSHKPELTKLKKKSILINKIWYGKANKSRPRSRRSSRVHLYFLKRKYNPKEWSYFFLSIFSASSLEPIACSLLCTFCRQTSKNKQTITAHKTSNFLLEADILH